MNFIKKNKIKKIGIILIIIVLSIMLISTKKSISVELDEVKLKEEGEGRRTFAIMVENDTGVYEEYTDGDEWPSDKTYNKEKSQCIDNNGDTVDGILTFDEENNKATVKTNKTVYCYLYFDIKKDYLLGTVIELAETSDDLAYDETEDNNLRFIGEDPDNYIYFNCDDYSNPTSDTCELWRIIGVFNNIETSTGEKEALVKIIRNDSIGALMFDGKATGVGSSTSSYGSNDWTDSQLMLMLNGYYGMDTSRHNYLRDTDDYISDEKTIFFNVKNTYYTRNGGPICVPQKTYKGIDYECNVKTQIDGDLSGSVHMIVIDAVWALGGAEEVYGSVIDFYAYERGDSVYAERYLNWTGPIALMYPSDYGYATGGGNTTDRETCLETALYKWNSFSDSYSDCYKNDWLYDSSYQWTLTPYSGSSDDELYLDYDVYIAPNDADSSFEVKPVVYLDPSVYITSGSGTETDPWILNI